MAAISDKAQYFLEQSVPQLRQFESLQIFSKPEITSLVKKRSDFEHLVLSPGSKPVDFVNYIKWERSLESLRAKRCKRLQIRKSSSHAGEGRIFGLYERAVQRHPGDLSLWKEYLKFAEEVKASKRWRKVMSRALRMHPNKPQLWVIAGRRAAANGDMPSSRGFFMRGARFCIRDATVWVEYARCEMEWLGRMESRKGKKGGVQKAVAEQADYGDDDAIMFGDEDSDDDADENGRLVLPDPDAKGTKKVFDDSAVQNLASNPALDGAIPIAIYDISRKQPFFAASVAEQFFNMFAECSSVSVQSKVIQHVLNTMAESYPNTPSTCNCQVRQPLVGLRFDSAEYPKALREALARLKTAMETTNDKPQLAQKTKAWIEPVLLAQDLDAGIRAVLEYTIGTLPKS